MTANAQTRYNLWLHRFAELAAVVMCPPRDRSGWATSHRAGLVRDLGAAGLEGCPGKAGRVLALVADWAKRSGLGGNHLDEQKKAADLATAHTLGGRLCFVTVGLLSCLTAFLRLMTLAEIAPATTIFGAYGASPSVAVNK